jgi:hypothetical protein
MIFVKNIIGGDNMKKIMISVVAILLLIFINPAVPVNMHFSGVSSGVSEKNSDISTLQGIPEQESEFLIDILASDKVIRVLKNGKVVKKIKMYNAVKPSENAELAVEVFTVEDKREEYQIRDNKQYKKHYMKFFENSFIETVDRDDRGKIIMTEALTSGNIIKVSARDSEWMYNNIPQGAVVLLHY